MFLLQNTFHPLLHLLIVQNKMCNDGTSDVLVTALPVHLPQQWKCGKDTLSNIPFCGMTKEIQLSKLNLWKLHPTQFWTLEANPDTKESLLQRHKKLGCLLIPHHTLYLPSLNINFSHIGTHFRLHVRGCESTVTHHPS